MFGRIPSLLFIHNILRFGEPILANESVPLGQMSMGARRQLGFVWLELGALLWCVVQAPQRWAWVAFLIMGMSHQLHHQGIGGQPSRILVYSALFLCLASLQVCVQATIRIFSFGCNLYILWIKKYTCTYSLWCSLQICFQQSKSFIIQVFNHILFFKKN